MGAGGGGHPAWGQLVVGPPGAGKTTFCDGMLQLLGGLKRKVAVVNLDPANDALRYEAAVDVAELVSLENVQRELGLGPNGGASIPAPPLPPPAPRLPPLLPCSSKRGREEWVGLG